MPWLARKIDPYGKIANRTIQTRLVANKFIEPVVIMTSFNIALLHKYHSLTQAFASLQYKQQQRRQQLRRMSMAEIGRWQAQIAAWSELEKAIEYWQQQKPDQALPALDQALQKYEDLPVAYYLRGLLHSRRRNLASAIADFSEYISYAPVSTWAYWHRARLYLQQNQKQLAIADLQQALIHNPRLESARKLLSELQVATPKEKKAAKPKTTNNQGQK